MPITFASEMFKIVVRHEAYSFLNGYPKYQHISIALEKSYKIAFIINW